MGKGVGGVLRGRAEAQQIVKRKSRNRRKRPKIQKPDIEIKRVPHRSRNATPTEITTDDEDMITYRRGGGGTNIFSSIFDIHWCAKIKDEVEKLAYQLNEEAERTERPIRRLTVKITPSCCLSEKWRIINLLDDIWMLLPEIESLGSWRKAAEFGIAHSIVSRLWRQLQTTGTAIRGFSSGRPRGTTPADGR
ncbi:hypothetical protein TNCV_4197881 [Trichonephila clavipes]|nr:hypothetical protein TNCV_4197881 [Trichonephila clavipes]